MVDFFFKTQNFFLGALLLGFSQYSYSNCIPIEPKDDALILYKLSYYNLQGNTKKVENGNLNLVSNYYKNYALGYAYLIGKNRLKDYELARVYLLESAKYCFSPAHYSLGYLYLIEGRNEEAKKWFITAKDLGDNLAAHQLAMIFKKENNASEMLNNLKFAAKNDFLPSVTELGVQYYDGDLVIKDFKKSFDYFYKAANMNDPLAQNNLGWMYEYGQGTVIDLVKAEYWYEISAENGFELANHNLERIIEKKGLKILNKTTRCHSPSRAIPL